MRGFMVWKFPPRGGWTAGKFYPIIKERRSEVCVITDGGEENWLYRDVKHLDDGKYHYGMIDIPSLSLEEMREELL